MRVSTQQFYFQNAQQLSNKQSDVNSQMEYLSSGKRVLTAKDDAVAYGTLVGYQNELANIEKYQRNITQADSRNSLQEVSLGNAESLLQELKQLFIQANNGAMNDQDLDSLAEQARDGQAQLLNIANIKDETGGYIFAGYQIDSQPFALQADGSVLYLGDSGSRELQIAKNVMVETNQAGNEVFMDIDNSIGDFSPVYNTNTSSISVNRAVVANRGAYDTVANPPDYNFNFTSATDLTVTDGNGATVYSTAAYVPGQTVAFNGLEVQINGNPLPGDNFDLTPEENVSIFDTMKNAIDWMETGTNPSDQIKHNLEYAEILTQIDQALNHITVRRSEAGIRQQLIENQESNHLDNELVLSTGLANIEDLDFAKAVATFEQSQVALQAAQQSFVQIKNLSLFNYL